MQRRHVKIITVSLLLQAAWIYSFWVWDTTGNIGFNEPGEVFEAETHCVDLTESTIAANKRFFASEEEVPRQAYTMGIKTIMQAKKILLVVSGADKASIVKEAFYGAITPRVQASVLQLHKDVIIVADEAALSEVCL